MKPEIFCTYCREPILPGEPMADIFQPHHRECALRQVIGGLNHLRGHCTCCGGTLPPDPPGMSLRAGAIAAVQFCEERENALYLIARDSCHHAGVPWTDPRTGTTYPPPKKGRA